MIRNSGPSSSRMGSLYRFRTIPQFHRRSLRQRSDGLGIENYLATFRWSSAKRKWAVAPADRCQNIRAVRGRLISPSFGRVGFTLVTLDRNPRQWPYRRRLGRQVRPHLGAKEAVVTPKRQRVDDETNISERLLGEPASSRAVAGMKRFTRSNLGYREERAAALNCSPHELQRRTRENALCVTTA
jgi:hypothetical protein